MFAGEREGLGTRLGTLLYMYLVTIITDSHCSAVIDTVRRQAGRGLITYLSAHLQTPPVPWLVNSDQSDCSIGTRTHLVLLI